MFAVQCACFVAGRLVLLLGRRPPVSLVLIMDNILRELECLSRHELVWLNTYLAGRLRALPPASVQHTSSHPEVTTAASSTATGGPCLSGPVAATMAPLPERIDAINYSLDPWERTGAAPQGWANHLQQSLLPIQGYIQLRPQTSSHLPDFGTPCRSSTVGTCDTETAARTAPRRLGKASKSVSIFVRDPLCKDTCRYCRRRPCDVGCEHDDHTCYDCEQQLLYPEGVPGAPWQLPLVPGCESWRHKCTSQRCAVREPHDLHICMRCEHLPAAHPTPVRGGDPCTTTPDS